jgi:hypothetical protein
VLQRQNLREAFSKGLSNAGSESPVGGVLPCHTSIRVTERHYNPWVRSRQERLEAELIDKRMEARSGPSLGELPVRIRYTRRRSRLTNSPQNLVPGVGVEPLARLKERKLFIPRSGESDKTDRNAEVRYTAGTRSLSAEACAR